MDDGRLGGVVGRLHLRDVGDVARHGGRGNKASVAEVLQFLAAGGGALLLLPAPVQRSGAGTEEGAINVNGQHLLHPLKGAVDERPVLPRDARVGYEDVEPAIEGADDLVDGVTDGLP